MRAGLLDRRVTIRQPVETQSDSGEIITGWTDIGTVWAQQLNLTGFERYANQQVVGRALMTFRMRYSSLTNVITVKWRLFVDGREFDVTDVREPRMRETIEVDCFAHSEQPV